MNRRGFFQMLAGVAAAGAVDPERLLWTPGKKLISIPAPAIRRVLWARLIVAFDPSLGRVVQSFDAIYGFRALSVPEDVIYARVERHDSIIPRDRNPAHRAAMEAAVLNPGSHRFVQHAGPPKYYGGLIAL
jgi:hypothetical protein